MFGQQEDGILHRVLRAGLKAQYFGPLMKGKTEIWHSLLFSGTYLAE